MTSQATLNASSSNHGRQRDRRAEGGEVFGALKSDGLRRRMAMNNEVPPKQATEGDASSLITRVLPALWSSAAVATLRQSQGPDRLQAVRKRAPTPTDLPKPAPGVSSRS